MKPDFKALKAELEKLGAIKPNVFGAEAHDFVVNPPLSENEVVAFEQRHKINLPVEYRRFLLEVGNGGAGPEYGTFKLGEMDDGFGYSQWEENNGLIGILSQPFPHTERWNDLTGKPNVEMVNEDEYDKQFEIFDNLYWNPANVNGAIPICHFGCALRLWLIITGLEAGNIWYDGRTDREGLRPLSNAKGNRVTFYQWYRTWLDDLLAV